MKVAIDPGHGLGSVTPNLYDPGAVAKKNGVTFAEADFVLRYALSLDFLLREKGVDTFMTRISSADKAPVGKRAKRAEQAGCTHFVSLHMNSFGNTGANGTEVLYRADGNKKLAGDLSSGFRKHSVP